MGVSCPTHFRTFIRTFTRTHLLGLTLGDKRTPLPRPEICPQNLFTQQFLVVRGYKKQQRRRGGGGAWNYSSFTKVLFGLISPCITLPWLFQKRLSSCLQFGQIVNIHRHLFEKNKFLFYSPIPTERVERR